MSNIKSICGDICKVSDQIEDNSIDLLLTDPPYNISREGNQTVWMKDGKNISVMHNMKFDKDFSDSWDTLSKDEFKNNLIDWCNVFSSKLRPGGTFCIFISDSYVSHLWEYMENIGLEPKRIWTWKKPAAVPFNRNINPVSGCEYILFGIKPGKNRTFNSDAVKGSIVERYSLADKISSMLYRTIKDDTTGNLEKCFEDTLKDAIKVQEKLKKTDNIVHCVIPNTISYSGGLSHRTKLHPTQKPDEILQYFITLCSNEGDTILDTFAGSGSTGKNALSLNRKAILVEKDPVMFTKMTAQFSHLFD